MFSNDFRIFIINIIKIHFENKFKTNKLILIKFFIGFIPKIKLKLFNKIILLFYNIYLFIMST